MKTLVAHQRTSCQPLDFLKAHMTAYSVKSLRQFVPKQHLQWTGSARTALAALFASGEKVGVPSFTCHVVVDAIRRAGALPVFIDAGAVATVSDIEKSIRQIQTLVLPYNFGFVPDIEKIAMLCKKNNVRLIEDCAQALGAISSGKLAGSFGDAAIYSFGISKNIGICGGMLATDKPFLFRGKQYPLLHRYAAYAKAFIGSLFFHPLLYPYTSQIVDHALAANAMPLDYAMPDYAKYVIIAQAKRYHSMLATRKKNAAYLMHELAGIIDFVKPEPATEPAWLYFVLLHKNRDALQARLLKEGVDIRPLHTFIDTSKLGEKATAMEKNHLAFALLRPMPEAEALAKAIKRVVKNAESH